jgi:hypothetical protein
MPVFEVAKREFQKHNWEKELTTSEQCLRILNWIGHRSHQVTSKDLSSDTTLQGAESWLVKKPLASFLHCTAVSSGTYKFSLHTNHEVFSITLHFTIKTVNRWRLSHCSICFPSSFPFICHEQVGQRSNCLSVFAKSLQSNMAFCYVLKQAIKRIVNKLGPLVSWPETKINNVSVIKHFLYWKSLKKKFMMSNGSKSRHKKRSKMWVRNCFHCWWRSLLPYFHLHLI